MDRAGSDDDETSTPPPEVTVPPWLRTGPTSDESVAPVRPSEPTPDAPGNDPHHPGAGGPGGRPDAADVAPNRITLGTRSPGGSGGPGADRVGDDLSSLPLRPAEPGTARPSGAASARPGPATAGSGTASPISSSSPTAPPTTDGRPVDPHAAEPHTSPPESPPPGSSATSSPQPPDDQQPPRSSAWERPGVRLAALAVAGVAVLAGSGLVGFFLTRGVIDTPAEATAGCVAPEGSDLVVGDGPGSLETPAGAVLAFDHAYYVDRSAEKAFEAVAPSSRMSEDRLRTRGVEQVVDGTTHCVEIGELSPTLLDVTLTEYPPDGEPVEIRQHVRVAENPDGTWGIVSIRPAG